MFAYTYKNRKKCQLLLTDSIIHNPDTERHGIKSAGRHKCFRIKKERPYGDI